MKKAEQISRKEVLKLISESSIYGNLGLFIGAGMSMAVLNDEDEIALSWKKLIYKLADEFQIDLFEDIQTEGLSYPEIATELAKEISKKEKIDYTIAVNKIKSKIADLTSWYPEKEKRDVYGKLLLNMAPNWIITTNYDLIIECLLTGKSISLSPDDQLISPKNLIPIYHLHGIRTNPNSIIISQEDYISLFRPNQYRQQKLSLSIKESTTLIIGYGLGDVNVLTAVDWVKNVYSNQKINYPHDIIQLLYKERPEVNPYRDRNGIIIVEFNDLQQFLNDVSESITVHQRIDEERCIHLKDINEYLENPDENVVKSFIDDVEFRSDIISTLAKENVFLITGFLELFSKAIDETWERSIPNGAFHAYNENLTILIEILINIDLEKIPPALFESIVYNLDKLSFYIGTQLGESRAAYYTWQKGKDKIPSNTYNELKNISTTRKYTRLKRLLR